ncbi:MAG: type VI secretion system tip protein VgrG [Agarilytica sp.]
MSITQEQRTIAIGDFSLGADTFLLTGFEGSEYISDLSEFNIDVISENLNINPESIVGKTTTVTIQDDFERVFHGYIRSFTYGEIAASDVRQYKMTMVPWLWFLTKTNNHRIFQDKNTKEIISHVFQNHGFTDFDFRAQDGTKREYCIQHNESDFNFVSRLLEEEGIAYYFQHESNKHKLILVDQKNAYDEFAQSNLEYSNGSSPNHQLSRWEHLYNYKKGQWSFSDYNFKEPAKKLFSNTKTTSKFANNANFEHYEYGAMNDFSSGDDLVKIRLDAEEAGINLVSASSDCTTFYAGGKFKVEKHDSASEKGEYIVVRIHHRAFDNTHLSGQSAGSGYTNNFICIPSDVHFRPQQIHKRPVMRGPQSAIVTGPAGEEIYVDDLGRVKVQFYWDRDGNNDENTSCFIRVMQQWAGAQWGASFIPRIGHEVIVDFIEGDPDRPIITGTVYNGKNKPPFDSKTKSGWRTRSSKSGSAANCNELIFDDKKDNEQIFIHAEKNMDTEVENDETLTVDNDRSKHVKHDESSTIDNDRSKTIGNNQSESIGKNVTISVGENHDENIGTNMTVSVGKDLSETVGGKHTENVSKEYKLSAKSITLEAQDQITLKTGSAQIVMKKSGDITISGKNINVKGSGNVVLKGSKVTAN